MGHALGDRFWPTAHQFPAQNFKGKHNKQPLSRKVSNKIESYYKSAKGNKSREKENSRFSEQLI